MIPEFNIKAFGGLSSTEAALKLQSDGFNELPSTKKRSIFAIALEVVREPMFLLLISCGTIYLALGEPQEALILLAFVFVVMGITLYQERKTERALEALRDLSSPRALVIRDNEPKRIPGREVVCGDIAVLAEGDRVPADAVLLSCLNLSIDESLLTGESLPVRKTPCKDNSAGMGCPGGDDLPFVYSGTLVVQGQGIACVKATGAHTELGKIGKALQAIESEQTPLQRETARLVVKLALFGLFLCGLIVIVYGLTRGNWLKGILSGITLAMAILPEEFPVVLTIFLAMGAWRISQKRVLARRVSAVETLGSTTVLCVDKTGTLTLNQMSVSHIYADGDFYTILNEESNQLPEKFHALVEFGILASQKDPFDPMEKALRKLGDCCLKNTEHLHDNWTLVREYPLSQELLSLSLVWRSPNSDEQVIAAKGAPEAIADLSHMTAGQIQELAGHIHLMADQGLRVLGVARAFLRQSPLPGEQHDFHFEFLGLIGFSDPVRPNVAEAIAECHTAGIRVAMITGDYPGTARSIAGQIGLTPADDYITGRQLDKMDDNDLKRRIQSVNLFARVVPEQKLRLVNALKANGEIVAMTGDGVNDAPALKSAHIGIAMGGRGTDVAREASALVILDDDFASIVQAIRQGRRIFDNLCKAVAYIFAIHIPIAGMSLLPVLFHWPLVFFPLHIAFLELIIDPACSFVFEAEPEEADVMKRPPRDPKKPLFGMETVGLSLLQGAGALAIILAVFFIALHRGMGEPDARALTFTSLVFINLALITTNRSWSTGLLNILRRPNAALWWVTGGAGLFLGLVLYVPFLRGLFRFAKLHPMDIGICLAAGIAGMFWLECLKRIRKHWIGIGIKQRQ
ncbi:MAG: cation-translocating P-type ATPase [Desulfobacteraceae bacterium]|nr:cation-translocating P-type ATPase [Desulfobacteraceae bacterium]